MKFPLPTREEAKALFDTGQIDLDKPITQSVTHEYLLLDLLQPDRGTVPALASNIIIESPELQWLEIQTQAWMLRVEPAPEHPLRRDLWYQLRWQEVGQEPVTESIAVEEMYQAGFPLVPLQQGVTVFKRLSAQQECNTTSCGSLGCLAPYSYPRSSTSRGNCPLDNNCLIALRNTSGAL